MMKTQLLLLVGVLSCPIFMGCTMSGQHGSAASDFGSSVRQFSTARHALALDLSARLNLPLPPQADAFFRVATTGQWESVSNQFEQLREQDVCRAPIEALRNELWVPIHETLGVWEVWVRWKRDSALLARFYEPVLASMPQGSVYLGGTDYGRFVITAVNALQSRPRVFCISQHMLLNGPYAAHLRAVYGDEIWLFKQADVDDEAQKRYVERLRSANRADKTRVKIEGGRAKVTGALGFREFDDILCEMIFEHNKRSHDFFVEEGYVMTWMYPYLEPYGLIMKLNPYPADRLSQDAAVRDRDFWKRYEALLVRQPSFTTNHEARKAFSKMRCAIAGIYVYRQMFEDAEDAFRQAIRLCPMSPEPSFRLAMMFEEQKKIAEAVRVMDEYLRGNAMDARESAEDYMTRLRNMPQNNDIEPIR